MGIAPKFSAADVHKMVEAKMQGVTAQIEAKLIRVGNKFVADARQKADFTDRTGNLRSSIGFIVLKDGKQIAADFEKSVKGTDKVTGEVTGVGLANQIGNKFNKGYTLVVVAGMEYAAAVESKGRDVLTGSSIQAVANLSQYFKRK